MLKSVGLLNWEISIGQLKIWQASKNAGFLKLKVSLRQIRCNHMQSQNSYQSRVGEALNLRFVRLPCLRIFLVYLVFLSFASPTIPNLFIVTKLCLHWGSMSIGSVPFHPSTGRLHWTMTPDPYSSACTCGCIFPAPMSSFPCHPQITSFFGAFKQVFLYLTFGR